MVGAANAVVCSSRLKEAEDIVSCRATWGNINPNVQQRGKAGMVVWLCPFTAL